MRLQETRIKMRIPLVFKAMRNGYSVFLASVYTVKLINLVEYGFIELYMIYDDMIHHLATPFTHSSIYRDNIFVNAYTKNGNCLSLVG